MPSLFDAQTPKPLAEMLRPQKIGDVVGQEKLLGETGTIRLMLNQKTLQSLIFWGPPGCGKTTLAKLLASELNFHFIELSAVFSGTADLKAAFEKARKYNAQGQKTLLFIDEIHRFNKAQQDSFLGPLETGEITLIGTTTENPSFSLNNALLSRAQVCVFESLEDKHLQNLYEKVTHEFKDFHLEPSILSEVKKHCGGDGRSFLNTLEYIKTLQDQNIVLTDKNFETYMHKKMKLYDKSGDEHYNLISALHKSMRGSDPDAALYWFCRMLEGGEDPRYLARRLIRFAAEDVGLASPQALQLTLAADQTYMRLGSPEGEIALAQAVLYLATCPKSNAVYKAFGKATTFSKKTASHMPPAHILNAPTKMMKDLRYGKDYMYDHDLEDGFSGQNYFPENMERQTFYEPTNRGVEAQIRERCEQWDQKRKT